jgi:hypothetical protein
MAAETVWGQWVKGDLGPGAGEHTPTLTRLPSRSGRTPRGTAQQRLEPNKRTTHKMLTPWHRHNNTNSSDQSEAHNFKR